MAEDSAIHDPYADGSDQIKPPMTREQLRDVIDLSLWAGQLLLQHGAETARIEETVHRLGTGLGCNWMDILVSPNALVVTAHSGQEFRTKVRRIVSIGVDMNILAQVSDLSYRVNSGELDRHNLRRELERIDRMPRQYNRWLVVLTVGLSCAAFSKLFNADWPVFGVTFLAAACAMFIRQELSRHFFNPLLVTAATAFAAGLVGSAAALFRLSPRPQIAIAAAVLLLVPGVPLINAAEDLIKGHMVTGIIRGLTGMLISLTIALGLLLALWLTGVEGL